ncbi:hypothetical protein Syun_025636 [Stephania yunnanensis]|uniref:Uncharacterized protein n=1 Tax=Stephania yunnanensis TaxID=152371 RepID=A0AAP0ESS9_9MAGN
MNVPAIHGGLLKPDVVEGTDDERVWRLPCWELTETSKRDDGIDLLKDNQALQRLTGTDDNAKMDLSSLTRTNIRLYIESVQIRNRTVGLDVSNKPDNQQLQSELNGRRGSCTAASSSFNHSIAVNGSARTSYLVIWALQRFSKERILFKLLHVFPSITAVPTDSE